MFFRRALDVRQVLAHRSCLLLGPRQTGKSRLLRETLADARTFDLLDHRTFALGRCRKTNHLRCPKTNHQPGVSSGQPADQVRLKSG